MAPKNQVAPNSELLPRTATQSSRPFHHRVWSGLSGKERRWIGWKQSARAIAFSSCKSCTDICADALLTSRNAGLNALLVFIPLAWLSHFHEWTHGLTFARMLKPFAIPLCVHKVPF